MSTSQSKKKHVTVSILDSDSTLTTTTGETQIITGVPSDNEESVNLLSAPLTKSQPSVQGSSANSQVSTQSMWLGGDGKTYKHTLQGVFVLDETKDRWITMVPEAAPALMILVVTQATNPPQGTPTCPVNSWTNLQIWDAQTVLATQARSSPTRVWAEEIEATNTHIDWVNDTMQTLRGNLSTIGLLMPERDTANQLGTSAAAEPPVDPVNNPIGTQLQMIPKALYAHIPMVMQRTMMAGAFTDFRNLLLDPLVLLRASRLSYNPDTGVAKWVETNMVKDIPNFDTWVKAYYTYMAIYLMANPTRALEMVKYEHIIHDASLRYDWRSILLYDVTFC